MINKLRDISEDLAEAQNQYLEARATLKNEEATLWIADDVNWEEEIGKSKPTQKDKEAWITLQLDYRKDEVNEKLVKYEYLKRLYEIQKMEVEQHE